MDDRTIQFGTRKLQRVHESLTVNIQSVFVRTLGLKAGESMTVSMQPDDSLRIVKA